MFLYKFFLVSILISVIYAKIFMNSFTNNLLKNVPVVGNKNENIQRTVYSKKKKVKQYYAKEKNRILKKKKKKFSLNYSKCSEKYCFLNSSKFNEIKENIKVLFNIDYAENNIIFSYIKSFKRTPPITKFYLITTFLLSVLIHINKNVYKLILFDFNKIFKKCEVWRLFSPYLYIGNLYLQYILMFNYLNIYMSAVEIAHYKKPEDFLIFLTFGYLSNIIFAIIGSMYNENIINMKKNVHKIISLIIKQNNKEKIEIKKEHYNHLGYVFSTYILYYWSRINEGSLINCFELFLIKAEYVPFFFIIQNILLYNEFSFYEVASILSSYTFFTYEKYLKLEFLRYIFLKFLKCIRVYNIYDKYKEEYE
ncbi:DER1-like protein, putative [Plasmodium relictum]|uniref:Derlin n=1 Tax=Plasmodium relictum TaxID=85471 RepID=A0A1J1H5F6_PLARL|nr:DER1-like protein, putative [Plasmodium relictum]CRG99787.1 DER1-like protein, putative [Plasmodium relictum]